MVSAMGFFVGDENVEDLSDGREAEEYSERKKYFDRMEKLAEFDVALSEHGTGRQPQSDMGKQQQGKRAHEYEIFFPRYFEPVVAIEGGAKCCKIQEYRVGLYYYLG
jgi:hypothetical protein